MLVASTDRHFSSSRLQTTMFIERRFRAAFVMRDRLMYDTKYAPPSLRSNSFVHFYLNLQGTIEVLGKPPITARQAWILAETEFERVTADALTFRSYGEPTVIFELRVPERDVLAPVGIRQGSYPLSDELWAIAQRMHDTFVAKPDDSETQLQTMVFEFLERLRDEKIIASDLVASSVRKEPEQYVRLWNAVRPLLANYNTSASLREVAQNANVSLRQLGRDLKDLTRTFGLFGDGFRDAARVLRLRIAVMLLSAPGSTASDVADVVGYGSLDAMGRAFRDAKMPPPSTVLAAVKWDPHRTTQRAATDGLPAPIVVQPE
jgi:AraC-like DNA-binding protein